MSAQASQGVPAQELTVLVLAGGTGGHVYPALAVAEQMTAQGWSVAWLGSRRGMEVSVVPAAGIALYRVAVSGLRGRGLVRWLSAPLMICGALVQSLLVLARLRPRIVLGMGGFVAGPAGVAAWLLRRPLLIHEQNAVAGLTNRLLAPLAVRVMEAFPGSFPGHSSHRSPGDAPGQRRAGRRPPLHTGNPVRAAIAALGELPRRQRNAQQALQVVVLGGSQGAEALNTVMPEAVRALQDDRSPVGLRVRHQSGRAHLARTRDRYATLREVEVEPFYGDMAELYAWADVVVCRAGAMTVAELAVAGVASILVPYPHAAGDHQRVNASHLAEHGAALILDQAAATAPRLAELLRGLRDDPERLRQMSLRARAQGVPDAASRVVACCQEVLDAA